VPHVVLNAKYHAKEAEIVAQAGRKKAITIATNMAGRGTDILLGGNPEFLTMQTLREKGLDPATAPPEELREIERRWADFCAKEREEVIASGGLHILGTERHEARRIDNQLRGRAGRQGDPGTSRFYLSLEDDLMRIFASDRISGIMQTLGMEEGVPIESKLVTRQIERAQKQVEARNFEIRKHLLKYDDVMNKQREAIYAIRRELLEGTDQKEYIEEVSGDIVMDMVDQFASREKPPDTWDMEGLRVGIGHQFGININQLGIDFDTVNYPELSGKIEDTVRARYKEGIGLRGYGQRDPLIEYKKESFEMFEALRTRIEEETVRFLYLFEPVRREEHEAMERAREEARRKAQREQNLVYRGAGDSADGAVKAATIKRESVKVGRNDPCPCGSGKKFKKCHGA
jgi:preprotein translocase subunit SecA